VQTRGTVAYGSLRPRSALLPIGLVLLTLMASAITHVVGGGPVTGETGREAGEVTEALGGSATILPSLFGALGSLLLLVAIRLLHRRSLNGSWFLLVPSLAFGLQEFAERLFNVGGLGSGAAEPSLMTTLLVQLPFAAISVLLARFLRAGVRRVIERIRASRGPRWIASRSLPTWGVPRSFVPSLAVPAGAYLGRAPPALR
jgi:hypothetical protein